MSYEQEVMLKRTYITPPIGSVELVKHTDPSGRLVFITIRQEGKHGQEN